jgi:hypothetical protein
MNTHGTSSKLPNFLVSAPRLSTSGSSESGFHISASWVATSDSSNPILRVFVPPSSRKQTVRRSIPNGRVSTSCPQTSSGGLTAMIGAGIAQRCPHFLICSDFRPLCSLASRPCQLFLFLGIPRNRGIRFRSKAISHPRIRSGLGTFCHAKKSEDTSRTTRPYAHCLLTLLRLNDYAWRV